MNLEQQLRSSRTAHCPNEDEPFEICSVLTNNVSYEEKITIVSISEDKADELFNVETFEVKTLNVVYPIIYVTVIEPKTGVDFAEFHEKDFACCSPTAEIETSENFETPNVTIMSELVQFSYFPGDFSDISENDIWQACDKRSVRLSEPKIDRRRVKNEAFTLFKTCILLYLLLVNAQKPAGQFAYDQFLRKDDSQTLSSVFLYQANFPPPYIYEAVIPPKPPDKFFPLQNMMPLLF